MNMNMNIKRLTVATLFTLCISSAIAENQNATIGDVEMAVSSNSPAFEAVKQKLGKWEGQMTQSLDGAVFDVSYEYKLTSGGNTITETIIEDGVEMLSTYSDEDGKLVVKHYCALGTEPVFKVSGISSSSMSISLDEAKNDLHTGHHSFVTGMTWTTDSQNPNSMVFENSVSLDGKITTNKATLKRSM
jgi:hypothetical protein